MVAIKKYRSAKETKMQTKSVRVMETASLIKTGINETIFRNKIKNIFPKEGI